MSRDEFKITFQGDFPFKWCMRYVSRTNANPIDGIPAGRLLCTRLKTRRTNGTTNGLLCFQFSDDWRMTILSRDGIDAKPIYESSDFADLQSVLREVHFPAEWGGSGRAAVDHNR